MNIVFFEDKTILFTDDPDAVPECGRTVEVPEGGAIGIAKVFENLENSKSLCIKATDADSLFSRFASGFSQVDAAGGLVRNAAGETLMILRNGWWDLPKGHIDPGEDPRSCAVREVSEECGLRQVEAGERIACTRHVYRLGDRWTMKTTHWYAMRSGQRELTPQREEGITRAEWVPEGEVGARLDGSYSTIREVFRRAGFLR